MILTKDAVIITIDSKECKINYDSKLGVDYSKFACICKIFSERWNYLKEMFEDQAAMICGCSIKLYNYFKNQVLKSIN